MVRGMVMVMVMVLAMAMVVAMVMMAVVMVMMRRRKKRRIMVVAVVMILLAMIAVVLMAANWQLLSHGDPECMIHPFIQAFDIAMAVTANFKDEERITGPWLDGAEDLDECTLLLNRLLEIWKELLPLTDEELRIGSGQTRTVIAESVRSDGCLRIRLSLISMRQA